METDDGGHDQSGPQPNTISETSTAPESSGQPPLKEGGVPTPPTTSINPEAPDTLTKALQHASVIEEHYTLMGSVVEKIQFAKSGLNEAFTSLLTGFEVCDVRCLLYEKTCACIQIVAPETMFGFEKSRTEDQMNIAEGDVHIY